MESGLDDFIRQVPTGPIVMLCVSGILMVIALVAIVRARTQRAKKASLAASQAAPAYVTQTASQAPAYVPASRPVTSELPDLDMLIPASPQNNPPPAPAAPRAARKGTHSVTLNDGETTEAVEVMTILRDVVNGGLIVQIGDKSYRNLANDDSTKTSFMKIMRELAGVVKSGPLPSQKVEEPVVKIEEPVVRSPQPDLTPSASFDEAPSLRDLMSSSEDEDESDVEAPAVKPKPAYIPPPPTNPSGEMPGDLPKYKWDDKTPAPKKGGLFRRGKLDLEPVPELNIAAAIEAYLQHKLKYTPGYETRSIHVHPSPDGGVSIEVDGKFYDAVGDVAETDVREFLSATIQEWQQRN